MNKGNGNLNINNTILPILSVIALCIGNYLRLGEVEIASLEQSFFAIATAVATIYAIFGVWKDKNENKKTEKK